MKQLMLVGAVVIAACSHKANDGAVCKAQVDDLMSFLHTMDRSRAPFEVEDVALVMRPELSPRELPMAPSITIKPDAYVLNGKVVEYDLLPHELRVVRKGLAGGDPDRMYLLVDARTPWKRVTNVAIAAAHEGFTTVSFVFGRPSPVPPPPRSSVDDRLDAIMRGDRSWLATRLAEVARDVMQPCPALAKVFSTVTENEDVAKFLIDGTGPALLACDCHVDLPALRSVMWRLVGNPHPTVALDVTLVNEGADVMLPRDTPWAEASTHLQPGMKLWPVAPVPPPPHPQP